MGLGVPSDLIKVPWELSRSIQVCNTTNTGRQRIKLMLQEDRPGIY
jgi:hypothetical protein